MKKATAIIGVIVGFIITLGALFKIQHYPGGSILLILGLGTLTTFFIPLFFISRTIDEKTTVGKVGNIFALISLELLFMGILFKIQHYPGAGPMLILGAFLFLIPTSILLLIAAFKNKKSMFFFLKGVMATAFVAVWAIIFATQKFSGNTASKLLVLDEELNYSNEYLEMQNEELFQKITTHQEFSSHTLFINELESLHSKQKNISALIQNIDHSLINAIGDKKEITRGHWHLSGIKDSDRTGLLLIGSGDRKDGRAYELANQIQSYQTTLKKIEQAYASFTGVNIQIPSAEFLFPQDLYRTNYDWVSNHFDHTPAFIAFPTLAAMKHRVLITQNKIYTAFLETQGNND